jgi:hypothetical protein
MYTRKPLLLSLCLLLLAGCSTLLDRHELVGSWELREAAIEAGEIAPEDMAFTSEDLSFPVTLLVRRDNSLFGRACNFFNGTYTVPSEGHLFVRDWLQTAQLCSPEGSPNHIIDRAFTGLATHSPVEFDLVADSLIISYDGVRLEFRRAD